MLFKNKHIDDGNFLKSVGFKIQAKRFWFTCICFYAFVIDEKLFFYVCMMLNFFVTQGLYPLSEIEISGQFVLFIYFHINLFFLTIYLSIYFFTHLDKITYNSVAFHRQ